ncbi:MAG: Tol-Pal system beta propeller repeat protein TolB [Albidovulum sp.]|nr:Tol-Pal system beta propeller repeat protein TolB [Albidovulum sp.]MDE0531562.1 Tol-Pal system beta propeller repeat protein TolB [Albidovulum sp.]
MTIRATIAIAASFAIFTVNSIALAQGDNPPLRIEITEGVIEPVPIATAPFVAETVDAAAVADEITSIIVDDLVGSGLFRNIPPAAHIAKVTNFDSPVQYSDWKAINAEALITGSVEVLPDQGISVKFRLFDVFIENPIGDGMKFTGSRGNLRRLAHKVADVVYSRMIGEEGYFDSRVAFVSESGPKGNRVKRLAIMDYDGANVQYLTSGRSIVLAPRFSPDGQRLIYTSYESGVPRVYIMDIATQQRRELIETVDMSFAPRFSPDGRKAVLSLARGSNTDIFEFDITTGNSRQFTFANSIETAPSYSPDGRSIVFESDRSGSQQIYVQPLNGRADRISFGQGRYGTPVWSPRGDYIAFTKQIGDRFHIGVMRTDGSEERLLSESFLDEGPTWSPNGRVLMFFRETRGEFGAPFLVSVDVTGRNLKRVPTPEFASDPAWSPLLK